MINSNREEFEKLPEIAESIKDGDVYFDEKEGCYIATDVEFYYDAGYANGAWYTFQEQQKKLDCCQEENKALLRKLNIPDGYKLVPAGINDEIESAMFSSVARGEMPCDIYKAMIGAVE